MSTVTEIKLIIDDLVDTSASTFSDARKVRGLNKAQDKIFNLIMEKDTLYQWDDHNYSDLNEGYLDIVSGTDVYSFEEDENNARILFIANVYIKEYNESIEYIKVEKLGKFTNVDDGVPNGYRITGKKIKFNRIFDYAETDGIKLDFIREPQAITVADTTKKPGIPDTFHHLLALYVAYDYARAKRMDNRNDILSEVLTEERRLGIFVNNQDNDTNITMEARYINSE